MDEHLNQARGLTHPFDNNATLESDLDFTLEGNARIGPLMHRWRDRQLRRLGRLLKALMPLDEFAISKRPSHAIKVSQGQPAVSLAVVIILLEWPDKSLPWDLVNGFQLTGHLQRSGIFRSVPCETYGSSSQLLGDDAISYVDALCSVRRPHQHAVHLLEAVAEEQQLGLCSEAHTRSQVDQLFGAGGWRPMPRHIISQGSKWRPIDDGKH
eukprot:12409447-Karenia_brevis.AAC.1